jgi:hypothetical protein
MVSVYCLHVLPSRSPSLALHIIFL